MVEKSVAAPEASPKNTGLVYVFTGDGKGKTSTALWTAMRAAIAGKEVAIVHWYKESRWPTNDQKIRDLFPNLRDFLMGQGFYNLPSDHASSNEHILAAQAALTKAEQLLSEVDVLVLDEIINAIGDGLLEESAVLALIERRGATHLILSGRGASTRLIGEADLVTEMKKVKHPFDKGKKAIKGLDF